MKAIENVREKANQVINRYGKVIFTFLIFFTLLGTAQVAEAQSGLKINSLSEVTDKAKEGADTILDVAKYILAAMPLPALPPSSWPWAPARKPPVPSMPPSWAKRSNL